MTAADDREAFEENKRRQAARLGRDGAVLGQVRTTLRALDRYDYSYLWSWMGVPIIQLPSDVMATQEIIWATKPDVVIETGIARGGSVVFMAAMLELLGKGKVIGIDVDIRPHNRRAIETHPMAKRISLIEGGSTDAGVADRVRGQIPPGAAVMVVLDSDHSRDHVLAELRHYGPLVTPGCYLVVADTMLGHLEPGESPPNRSKVWERGDEPLSALKAYLQETDRFEADEVMNGKMIFSSSFGGFLRCRKPA
jgi:cephalosporin hydroxylase